VYAIRGPDWPVSVFSSEPNLVVHSIINLSVGFRVVPLAIAVVTRVSVDLDGTVVRIQLSRRIRLQRLSWAVPRSNHIISCLPHPDSLAAEFPCGLACDLQHLLSLRARIHQCFSWSLHATSSYDVFQHAGLTWIHEVKR